MFCEQTISLLSVTYRLCWVCDWLAFDLAICHINYSGDVDLLYEDQDFAADILQIYVVHVSRFWFELSFLVIDKS